MGEISSKVFEVLKTLIIAFFIIIFNFLSVGSTEDALDVESFWVYFLDNSLSIVLSCCSENDYFVFLRKFLDELFAIRPHNKVVFSFKIVN